MALSPMHYFMQPVSHCAVKNGAHFKMESLTLERANTRAAPYLATAHFNRSAAHYRSID
jgi:hypothetical protein